MTPEQHKIEHLTRELAEANRKLAVSYPPRKREDGVPFGGDPIVDIRFDSTTGYIQVALASAPTTWVDKIQFQDPCA